MKTDVITVSSLNNIFYYKMGILLILYTNNKLNNSIFEVCLKYQ